MYITFSHLHAGQKTDMLQCEQLLPAHVRCGPCVGLQGNLVELSTDMGARGDAPEETPQRTTFNPALQFGVPPRDPPTFRMTMGLAEVTVRRAQNPGSA